MSSLPVGLFGASTGAAAALIAAAELPHRIAAVISRGGRQDLAGDALPHVRAPTLLIVGGADVGVIELNEEAFARLPARGQVGPNGFTKVNRDNHLTMRRRLLGPLQTHQSGDTSARLGATGCRLRLAVA